MMKQHEIAISGVIKHFKLMQTEIWLCWCKQKQILTDKLGSLAILH